MTGYSPKSIYIPSLDGLRFFAFLLVFFRHLPKPETSPPLQIVHFFSWAGVDLFFLLSGFLFYILLLIEFNKNGQINYKKFYLRRIFRIFPLYIFYTFSVFFSYFIVFDTNYIIELIAYYTFTINLWMAFTEYRLTLPLAGHLWSIAYEEQVYLVLPFLLSLIFRKNNFVLSITWAVTVLVSCILLRQYAFGAGVMHSFGAYLVPILRPESVIFGIFCGMLVTSNYWNKLPRWIFGTLFIISLIFFSIYIYFYGVRSFHLVNSSSIYLILSLIFSFALLSAYSTNTIINKICSIKIFVWMGKISYGLYVWHILSLHVTKLALKELAFIDFYFLNFSISLFLTIVIAAISYTVIEKPFINIKDKMFTIIHNRPA